MELGPGRVFRLATSGFQQWVTFTLNSLQSCFVGAVISVITTPPVFSLTKSQFSDGAGTNRMEQASFDDPKHANVP